MKRPYQIVGVVLLATSGYVIREAVGMEYYTPLGPGAGFFPFWVAIALALLALGMIYQATFQMSGPIPQDFFESRAGYMRMAAIVVAVVAVIVFLVPLGFRLTMLGFFLFLLFALGRQNLLVTFAVAIVGSFGIYQVFVEWLKIALPVGMLGI